MSVKCRDVAWLVKGRERGGTYVLETAALVVLQEAVLAAKVTLAEAAVADNALGGFPALLGGATESLAGHC